MGDSDNRKAIEQLKILAQKLEGQGHFEAALESYKQAILLMGDSNQYAAISREIEEACLTLNLKLKNASDENKTIPENIASFVNYFGERFLEKGQRLSESMVWRGHLGPVTCLSFSPDCKILASGSYDRTVKLRDIDTGNEIANSLAHAYRVYGTAFSPDGRTVITSGADFNVKVWNLADPANPDVFEPHKDWIFGISISVDGTKIATSSKDKTVKIIDSFRGKEICCFKGHSAAVNKVIFLKEEYWASCSQDRTVRIWSESQSSQERFCLKAHLDIVHDIAVDNAGTKLASAGGDGLVILWDLATGQKISEIKAHSSYVQTVAFSPDDRVLASGGADNMIILWDAKTGEKIQELRGHTLPLYALSFSPAEPILASAGDDGTVRIWRLA